MHYVLHTRMAEDRSWMYTGRRAMGDCTQEWMEKSTDFVDRAFARRNGRGVLCPCSRCSNTRPQMRATMIAHLCKYGFRAGYTVWVYHGESQHSRSDVLREETDDGGHNESRIEDMLDDVRHAYGPPAEEEPEPATRAFFDMLSAASQPLHGHTQVSQLDAITRLLAVKSQFSTSIACFDAFLSVFSTLLPDGHKLPANLYEAKKLISALNMPYEKIDVCPNHCMLFRNENVDKDHCDKCGESRFVEVDSGDGQKRQLPIGRKILRYLPFVPRIQRLYMSEVSAKQMVWHKYGRRYHNDKMVHPSDGEAWKQFDRDYVQFAAEPRNVRIAIATDGFNPFGMGAAPYSCWPVFVIPLNLPPGVCMQKQYIFLSLIIPGPEYPGKNMSVFMEPVVDELLHAWEQGIVTYDRALKQNFTMRVAYHTSMHDFPAYGIFCGWSVHGKMPCPICRETLRGCWLKHGRKHSFFDCHRQFLPIDHEFRSDTTGFRANIAVRSGPPRRLAGEEVRARLDALKPLDDGDGFEKYGEEHNWTHISSLWRLPYFHKLILPHNIDVMHNEKNVAEAIFSTFFDIPDKTKDNVKARLDQEELCNRPSLNMIHKPATGKWEKPRASYCLTRVQRKEILEWFQTLKFPDGYAANLRRGVNLATMRINGLKSHDYHIFMERLLPVMIRGYVPECVWQVMAELSFFYRQLCAKEIDPMVMSTMEREVPVLLCKLEKIFPPGFFNPMQHLILHLPYEARMGGPVQNRWMYPIEREQKELRGKAKNRSRVEASIAEAYIIEEISHFTSIYFADNVRTVHNQTSRYNIGIPQNNCQLSLFTGRGDTSSGGTPKVLSRDEWLTVMLYVFTNLSEVDDYIRYATIIFSQ